MSVLAPFLFGRQPVVRRTIGIGLYASLWMGAMAQELVERVNRTHTTPVAEWLPGATIGYSHLIGMSLSSCTLCNIRLTFFSLSCGQCMAGFQRSSKFRSSTSHARPKTLRYMACGCSSHYGGRCLHDSIYHTGDIYHLTET